MRSVLLSLVVLLLALPAAAQQVSPIEGTVTDASSGDPIGGAVIRVGGRRTYTSQSGRFRLPLPAGNHQINASSLGYSDTTFTAAAGTTGIVIRLKVSSIPLAGVSVSAELPADQIIRRAIERKEENRKKASTVQGLLYSKTAFEIKGNAFGQLDDADRQAIIETFARAYYSDRGPRLKVIQRRQTANVPAGSNLLALGDFISFYNDDLPVLNVTIPSPLNPATLSRYRFSIRERSSLNGQMVYVMDVAPATSVLPAFTGTIKIVADTYNLIEVDLRPSASTAISFVRDLRFQQKFEKFEGNIWQPTYLQVSGKGSVEIIRGLAQVDGDLTATSFFTELQINQPIPDSVYADERIISATPDADSVRTEFWQGNSLSELSEQEQQVYQQVDSLVAASDTTGPAEGSSFAFAPYINFNRVGSAIAGVTLTPRLGPLRLDLTGAYSFGMKELQGQGEMNLNLLHGEGWNLSLLGSLFSWIEPTTTDRPYPMLLNTATAALFYRDYYDYYRKDGWGAGLSARYDDLRASVSYENARHFALVNTVAHYIFGDAEFRLNPAALEGEFQTLRGALQWGNTDGFIAISSSPSTDINARVSGLYGEHEGTGASFRAAEGTLTFALPTIPTGYAPMMLQLHARGGIGSNNLPLQYQFRMRTSSSFIGQLGSLYSAPVGIYGGTRFVTVAAEHNFTDILWRAIGLPLYEGRGLELLVAGAAGRFENEAPAGYSGTGNQWYTEAGFGIGRIPIFISNVIYLRFDARWGIGPLGSGNFGATVGLSSPF